MQGKLRRTQLADWAAKEYPGHTVVNVTGEDSAPGHPPGYPSVYQGDKGTAHEGYYYLGIARPKDSISSSRIRRALAAGDKIRWMTPEAERRYVQLEGGRKKIGESAEGEAEGEGHWITTNGVHVLIHDKTGIILKGPPHLVGKHISIIQKLSQEKPVEKPDISKFRVRELVPGKDTQKSFKNMETGEYDAERTALHERPVEDIVDDKVGPTDRPPIGDILQGGTSAGKTTYSNHFVEGDPNKARIDNDEMKLYVPEYEGLKETDPDNAAGLVHEEASDMTHDVLNAAVSKGLDFVYDSTTSGNGGPQLVNRLTEHGYEIHLTALDAPISEAVARAKWRSEHSTNPVNFGRRVSAANIERAHYGAAARFFEMKDDPRISLVRLFATDNRYNRIPTLIYERIGNQPEKIYDPERFKQYRQKAIGQHEALLRG